MSETKPICICQVDYAKGVVRILPHCPVHGAESVLKGWLPKDWPK